MSKLLSSSTALAFDYTANEIDEKSRAALEKVIAEFGDVRARGTADAFKTGELMSKAFELIASEKARTQWLSLKCDMTVRHARNFIAIHKVLQPYKARCIDLKLGATPMIEMAAADDPDIIKAGLAIAEETGKLTVAQMKKLREIPADASEISQDPFENGGVDGLKTLTALKVKATVPSFLAHTASVILKIAEARSGKRVLKAKLAEALEADAEIAAFELAALIQPVAQRLGGGRHAMLEELPKASRWETVKATLRKLSNIDAWPEAKEMDDWLRDQVLPVLEWAVSKSAAPEWPAMPVVAKAAKSSNVLPFDGGLSTEATRARLLQMITAPKLDAHTELEVETDVEGEVETNGPELVLQ